MTEGSLSERALVHAPRGRDAAIASSMLGEGGIEACVCAQDDVCCMTGWDDVCVDEVAQFGCGTC